MSKLQDVLTEAGKLGVQLVGIKMAHPLLKGSESFPWPSNSLFANGYIKGLMFDPCAAWEIAKRADVWGSCGNHMQAQLAYPNDLPKGVWQLQADGWVQIA